MGVFWIVVVIAFIAWLFFKFGQSKTQKHEIVIRSEVITSTGNDLDISEQDEEKDNWESFNFHSAQLLPARGRYHITYTDQRGLTTERDIDIKRAYADNGKFAIDALCHLRGAHRSFIDERIKNAVDLDSGEVVSSVAQHAIAQYQDSGEGKLWSAIGREWQAVQILAFVCRADGRMMKVERAVVADYLKRHCVDLPDDDEAIDKAIKEIGEPDQREYKRIIADMKAAGDADKLRDVLDCARRIVATQKTIDPMEKAAVELIENAIG
jgi:hypothetical protein